MLYPTAAIRRHSPPIAPESAESATWGVRRPEMQSLPQREGATHVCTQSGVCVSAWPRRHCTPAWTSPTGWPSSGSHRAPRERLGGTSALHGSQCQPLQSTHRRSPEHPQGLAGRAGQPTSGGQANGNERRTTGLGATASRGAKPCPRGCRRRATASAPLPLLPAPNPGR